MKKLIVLLLLFGIGTPGPGYGDRFRAMSGNECLLQRRNSLRIFGRSTT